MFTNPFVGLHPIGYVNDGNAWKFEDAYVAPGEKPPNLLSWWVELSCFEKNFTLNMISEVAAKDEDLPLSKQQLPQVMSEMLFSFDCRRP